ncbi:MAG: ABC transporter permease [Alphaproteobacteria bacterium]
MTAPRSPMAAPLSLQLLYRGYLVLAALFFAVPVLVVVLVSFDAAGYVKFPPSGLTLDWYRRVFAAASMRLALLNSVEVGLGCTLLSLALGVPAAIVLARRRFRGRDAIYSLVMSPLTVPWIIIGLALLFLWGALGLRLNIVTLILGHTIVGIPYVVRTSTAALAGIDIAYELAARNLGAGRIEAFWRVTLPMMRMGILAGASFVLLISFVNVPVSLFVTTSDTVTLPIAIFSYLLSNYDPGVAAIATVQMAVILVVLALAQRIANARDFLL